MTNTPISICISLAQVESAFVERLEADIPKRCRWLIRVWHVWCLLWPEEVLHA